MKAYNEWVNGCITLCLNGTNCIAGESPHDYIHFSYGIISKGDMCLCLEEARQLIKDLIIACDSYEDLEEKSKSIQ